MNKLDNLGLHIIEDYAPTDESRAARLSSSEIHENYEHIPNLPDLQPGDFYLMDDELQAFVSSQFGLMPPFLQDAVNSNTVLQGAKRIWDTNRLNLRLKSFEKIGGERRTLQTPQSTLDATYFSPSQFFQATGAVPTSLHLEINNPLIHSAELVSIDFPDKKSIAQLPGARIQYNSRQKNALNHADELTKLCEELDLIPLWEESLKPIHQSEWSLPTFENKRILVIQKSNFFFNRKENQPYRISKSTDNSNTLPLFGQKTFTMNGLTLKGENPVMKQLNFQWAPWIPIRAFNQTVYINKTDENQKTFLQFNKFATLPFVNANVVEHSLPEDTGGAVILSMNQTNSYTQFSEEIVTFLMMGMHVLAYDNAQKGLSTGVNSQDELSNAVIAAGNFLIEVKGFRQNRIVFKGQCAGGLPTASVASQFRKAHFWIDQAPNNFSDVAIQAMARPEDNSWINRAWNWAIPTAAAPLVAALPSFNVIESLKNNRGIQIYTIGVPNPDNFGGDILVPDKHKAQFANYLISRDNGYYLGMPGATHVTHWWFDQNVYKDIQNIFKRANLTPDLFSK